MLCTVYYCLTWVILCFCVKWDAKTRLQSPSDSHVLQTAACVLLPNSPGLLHLCLWPSGAVQLCMCRAFGWIKEKWCATLVCKKKASKVKDIHSENERSSTVPNGGSLASSRFNTEPFCCCDIQYMYNNHHCHTSKLVLVVSIWEKRGAFYVTVNFVDHHL